MITSYLEKTFSFTPNEVNDSVNIQNMPEEIIFKIFSCLNEKEQQKCRLISKQWHRIASDDCLKKPKMAFGKEQWATIFGYDVGEEPPLSLDNHQIRKSPCPFWEGKTIEETHSLLLIPSSINGKRLTLNVFKAILDSSPIRNKVSFSYFSQEIIKEAGEMPINTSYWVFVANGILPESREKSYLEQEQLVEEYASKSKLNYQIPTALEALVCLITQFLSSETRVFSNSPWTYSSCQEKTKRGQVVVGGLDEKGRINLHCPTIAHSHYGASAAIKL